MDVHKSVELEFPLVVEDELPSGEAGVADTNKRKAEQRQQDRARRRLANLVHYENSLYNISTGGDGCERCPSPLALRTTTCDEKEEGKA